MKEKVVMKMRISIDWLIQLTGGLLKTLEQRNFISEPEIMNIYMLQDKVIKERPRHMKQLSLQNIFKRIAKKHRTEESSIKNPVPSTSAHPNVLPLSPSVSDLSPPSPSPLIPDISLTLQDDNESPNSPPPRDM